MSYTFFAQEDLNIAVVDAVQAGMPVDDATPTWESLTGESDGAPPNDGRSISSKPLRPAAGFSDFGCSAPGSPANAAAETRSVEDATIADSKKRMERRMTTPG